MLAARRVSLSRRKGLTLTSPANFVLTSTRRTGYSKSGLCTCVVMEFSMLEQRLYAYLTRINTLEHDTLTLNTLTPSQVFASRGDTSVGCPSDTSQVYWCTDYDGQAEEACWKARVRSAQLPPTCRMQMEGPESQTCSRTSETQCVRHRPAQHKGRDQSVKACVNASTSHAYIRKGCVCVGGGNAGEEEAAELARRT